jgi:hypothetical protein
LNHYALQPKCKILQLGEFHHIHLYCRTSTIFNLYNVMYYTTSKIFV